MAKQISKEESDRTVAKQNYDNLRVIKASTFGVPGTANQEKNQFSQAVALSNKLTRQDITISSKEGGPLVRDSGLVEMSRRVKEIANQRIKSWADVEPDEENQTIEDVRDNITHSKNEKPNELYQAPYTLNDWVYIPEFSSILSRTIEVIKNNVVGLGWEIVPYKRMKVLTDEEKELFEKEKEVLESFFEFPNNMGEDTTEISCKTLVTREYCGAGAFKFMEDIAGNYESMEYLAAFKYNVRKDGLGFVLAKNSYYGGDKEYFKVFGDKRTMDKTTGMFGSAIKGDDKYVPPEKRAASILWIPIYVPGSPVTGMPRYAPAKNSVVGNLLSSRLNVDFFVRGLLTRLLILVQNGRIDEDTEKEMGEFFDHSKGIENSKTAILLQPSKKSVVSSDLMGDDSNKVKIEIVKLLEGNKEDATYQKYRANNDLEQMQGFGLPKVYFGEVGDMTRAAVNVIRKFTQHQTFDPIAEELERPINSKVVPELLSGTNRQSVSIKNMTEVLDKDRIKLNLPTDYKTKYNAIEQLEYFKTLMRDKGYRFLFLRSVWNITDDDKSEPELVKEIVFEKKSVARFKYKRPELLDAIEVSELIRNTVSVGAWTPNSAIETALQRIFPDMEKFEEEWGDIPMNMLVMLINSKLAPFEDPLDKEQMELEWAKIGTTAEEKKPVEISEPEENTEEEIEEAPEEEEEQPEEVKQILETYGVKNLSEFTTENPDVVLDYLLMLREVKDDREERKESGEI